MSQANFLRAVVAGFIATYVMTMTGFWQAGIGLPRMDVGAMLAGNMGHSYNWGQTAHFLNGILMGLVYAQWLYGRLPGVPLVKGILFGIMATVAAGLVVVPIITASMENPAGVFFSKTPMPGAMIMGSLAVHLAYGIALGLTYRPAEET